MVRTTAKVDGMMCPMCESHVNDMIRKKFTVKKVSSNHKKNEAYIVSDEALTQEALESALSEMGYHCMGVTSEPYKRGFLGLF